MAELPSEIGQLLRLEALYVDDNQLTCLPPQIGQLTRLGILEIGDRSSGGNPQDSLPLELAKLEGLKTLKLEELELTDPPAEVVAQGTEAVLAYLREQLKQKTRIWESRLMVVDEGGVGKTQLLRALNGQVFQVDSETRHGIRVIPLPLPHPTQDGASLARNPWDFVGQEIYGGSKLAGDRKRV